MYATRIQKEIRSNRATQIAKQAAVKSVATDKKPGKQG